MKEKTNKINAATQKRIRPLLREGSAEGQWVLSAEYNVK